MENKSPILGGGGLSLRTGIDAVTRPNLVHETPALLLEQKPLNVFSRSPEPLGRDLSNFAHTPFTLDGKPYASVEGFYVSLLFRDPVKRAEVAQLHGAEAKKVGKGSNLTETTYEGQTFKLGSDTHHELIMRALRAKLEQHPDISAGLVATGSRPIIHDTGLANGSRRGFLTNETFAKMLTELRSELARKSQL
jgi:predicted NAD-dependent protein-ADP-ribosyltransferase YbiA (DUF1768 family)